MYREITSRENPEVRRFTLLTSSRKERREQGLFVTEGWKLTEEAQQSGCNCVGIYATQMAMKKYPSIVSEQVVLVSNSVAEKMAASVTTQGVFGVFEIPDKKTFSISPTGKYLLLENLQDPGNLGTILRTSAAFGISGVFLSESCPDPFGLKVLRASMGGVFRVSMVIRDIGEAIALLHSAGLPVFAAALDARALSVRDMVFGPCGIVVGTEGTGLSTETIACCDKTVMIPMLAGNESLNAAMAAGILLWEMTK